MNQEPKYLKPEEIAEELRVDPGTVRRWCRAGQLRAVRAGKSWLITRADLEAFMKQSSEEGLGSKKVDGLALAC